MPAKFDLAVYRGDTYRWQFRCWLDADKTQPADLTGATAKAEIRDRPGGANVTILAVTITLPNVIDVVLDAAASATLLVKGVWDLQLTLGSGDVQTVVAGATALTPDVTDSTPPTRVRVERGAHVVSA